VQFNRDALEQQLAAEHGIQYKWMGKELGGLRSRDKSSEANAGETVSWVLMPLMTPPSKALTVRAMASYFGSCASCKHSHICMPASLAPTVIQTRGLQLI
jgi:hypothetical protein